MGLLEDPPARVRRLTNLPFLGLGSFRNSTFGWPRMGRSAGAESDLWLTGAGLGRFYTFVKDPGRGERPLGEEPRAQRGDRWSTSSLNLLYRRGKSAWALFVLFS